MRAQLKEPANPARKVDLLRDKLIAQDALQRGEDYLRLTIDTIPVLAWCTRADGVYRWFLFRVEPLRDPQGTIVKWYGTNTDIDDRKRAEALLAAENQILEMVATGRPLAVILDGLCRLVDTLCDKSLASILLIDPNRRCLRRGAGPSFPEAFLAAVDGVEIGPCVGSCGTAAYRKEQVIVSDIATDPLWANYR